jgi:hypothetical protein
MGEMMMVVLAMFLAAWAVLQFAFGTPIGRAIHRLLVVWPAERLSRIHGGHILLAVLLAGVVATAWWLFQGDGIGALGMGAPDIAPFVTSIEVSTYLDVLAALIVSASMVRIQALRSVVRHVVARLSARRRAPRSRPARSKLPANDGEDGPARIALAA